VFGQHITLPADRVCERALANTHLPAKSLFYLAFDFWTLIIHSPQKNLSRTRARVIGDSELGRNKCGLTMFCF